mmetsp:Transcript_59601/g.129012  ORF Transcript_59601/g.129012 Transcript_59601/m.129012 type:complete len:930 (-) Transcript_59601:54-2843(-)
MSWIRTSLLLVAFLREVLGTYETWNLVDVAAVICPAIPDMPPYELSIVYNGSRMNTAAPHIVSFLRTYRGAVNVSFKIEDATGAVVVPQTTLQLQDMDTALPDECLCSGTGLGTSPAASTYGAAYGSSCQAWDNENCEEWYGNMTLGSWCCKKWCYAPGSCPDAYESAQMPGSYFSFAACSREAETSVTPCTWTQKAAELDPCTCKNGDSLMTADMISKFGAGYGSRCDTWDLLWCEEQYGFQADTWCCASWCYVDKECATAQKSLNLPETLFWSEQVCEDNPFFVAQCKFPLIQPTTQNNLDLCACTGDAMPAELRTSNARSLPADYGTVCQAHDKDSCNSNYPTAEMGIWCCQPWCWVGSSCPDARQHPLWGGHYYSGLVCDPDPTSLAECSFSDACKCKNPGIYAQLNSSRFPDSAYGTSCQAWDSPTCSTKWPGVELGDWCCNSWCYVNETCPIALISSLGSASFSYDVCTDSGENYVADNDTCVLFPDCYQGILNGRDCCKLSCGDCVAAGCSGKDGGMDGCCPMVTTRVCQNYSDHGCQLPEAVRRLSSRRRSFSSSSSRRRAPMASPTRRRSYSSQPQAPSRRRAPVPPPPTRRRAPPPMPAASEIRRRRSLPPVLDARRRSTALNGNTYQNTATGGQPYGYTNQGNLANNYGGNLPQQTGYGYSGANAYRPGSRPNVALYAAGGAAAGLVAGAGAYYMYDSYRDDGWRSSSNYRRQRVDTMDWCKAPEGTAGAGTFVECAECRRRYGACLACPQSGCTWTAPESINRDDLAATGFIPNKFTPPLKVTFSSISGTDSALSPSAICPAQDEAQREFDANFNKTLTLRADLFLTLTEQDILSERSLCNQDTLTSCDENNNCPIVNQQCQYQTGSCLCDSGYSFSQGECRRDSACFGTSSDAAGNSCLAWLCLVLPVCFLLRFLH